MRPRSLIALAGFILIALTFAYVSGYLTQLEAQVTYPPSFKDCTPDNTGNICLYVDVATPLSTNPTDQLPARVQYLPRVIVKAQWSSGWWGSTTRTATTDTHGRVVFMVPKGKSFKLISDASAIVVGLLDAQGLPQPHRYIDKTYPLVVGQENQRYMMVLSVNPQVGTQP